MPWKTKQTHYIASLVTNHMLTKMYLCITRKGSLILRQSMNSVKMDKFWSMKAIMRRERVSSVK